MTRDELYAAIDTLWGGNQSRAARDLNIKPRTMRAALTSPDNSSYRALKPSIAGEIRDLLEQFPDGVRSVDPRRSLAVLHDHMRRAGWTDGQAAAAILGAATALARQHLGDAGLQDVLDARPA